MSLLESATDLVTAQIMRGNVATADEVIPLLRVTHQTLLDLVGPAAEAQPAVDWKATLGLDQVTCMVCGQGFKQLMANHLQKHGLNAVTYRQRFHIPPQVPLSSKRATRRRRQIIKETRPWLSATRANKGRAK